MYQIISVLDNENTIFVVFNKISKKELARYSSYAEAFQDILSRQS
jgi:hypothetical protein